MLLSVHIIVTWHHSWQFKQLFFDNNLSSMMIHIQINLIHIIVNMSSMLLFIRTSHSTHPKYAKQVTLYQICPIQWILTMSSMSLFIRTVHPIHPKYVKQHCSLSEQSIQPILNMPSMLLFISAVPSNTSWICHASHSFSNQSHPMDTDYVNLGRNLGYNLGPT